jgi:hypothetical protein
MDKTIKKGEDPSRTRTLRSAKNNSPNPVT